MIIGIVSGGGKAARRSKSARAAGVFAPASVLPRAAALAHSPTLSDSGAGPAITRAAARRCLWHEWARLLLPRQRSTHTM